MLTMIQSRKSIRKYSQKPIPENELKEILKTGFSAPSGGNMQPWRVVVVKDQTRKDRLATAAYGQSFIAEAPVLLVVCAVPHESAEKYKERGATLYALQDTAALTQNILLASHALGYATCWIGAFNEDRGRILDSSTRLTHHISHFQRILRFTHTELVMTFFLDITKKEGEGGL